MGRTGAPLALTGRRGASSWPVGPAVASGAPRGQRCADGGQRCRWWAVELHRWPQNAQVIFGRCRSPRGAPRAPLELARAGAGCTVNATRQGHESRFLGSPVRILARRRMPRRRFATPPPPFRQGLQRQRLREDPGARGDRLRQTYAQALTFLHQVPAGHHLVLWDQ